jgi:signal transduction histidine kinase
MSDRREAARPDPSAQSFDGYLASRNLSGARLACLLVAALMPTGLGLDWMSQPDNAPEFLQLRLVASGLSLGVLVLTYLDRGRRWAFALGVMPAFIAAVTIQAMIERLDGYASPYYAGLNLCVLGLGLVFTWRGLRTALVCGGIVAIWLIPALRGGWPSQGGIFFNNLYFLVLTSVIAVASNARRYALARREFEASGRLATATLELGTALERLKEVDRNKSAFFANVTHELRTPITMILAPLESMLAADSALLTPTHRSYLEGSRRNGIRLLKLINDLLDLAKLEEGFLQLRPERTDLRPLLEDVLGYARPLATRKNLSLDLVIRGTPARLSVDLEKIERVLVNLLSNALKFTHAGGVTVTLEAEAEEVRIVVEDTGIGIASDRLESIFERFSQEDTSVTRRFGGTGIGLAYAKEIVDLHGGRLTVSSVRGKGSRFVVHLPDGDHVPESARVDRLTPAPQEHPNQEDGQPPRDWAHRLQQQAEYRFAEIDQVTDRRLISPDEKPAPTGPRVLVVEDNGEILELINLQLRDRYRVYPARDGRHGLELARRERPDLIVTDYMMPEMDGLTMLKALRADPQLAEIPVIMLSAKIDLADRLSAREAGADVYLGKPFSPRELEAAMRQLLGKQGRHIQDIMRAHAEGLETISAGLAHEIHNPLNFIKNANLVIAEDVHKLLSTLAANLEPEQAATVEKVRQRVARMVESAGRGVVRIEKVIEMLRHYARDGFPTEPSDVDFDEAVAEVTGMVAPAGEVEAKVSLDLGAEGYAVHAIPEELNQVIQSLVQNAVEAVGAGGQVKVKTRPADQQVLFEVTDNGPGISADSVPRIFSPFFTTKAGSGRGLGLAIVQVVVARVGGTVDVSSVPNVETTFRIRLPAAVTPRKRGVARAILSTDPGDPQSGKVRPGLA